MTRDWYGYVLTAAYVVACAFVITVLFAVGLASAPVALARRWKL